MQFERIRKSHKKEVLIGGLVVLGIVSAITLVTTKAKYKVTQDISLVNGTINYKPYDFKIMAMYQQNDSGTYTEINTMPSEGYIVNEDKTYCTTDNKTQIKGKIKTIDGNHIITGLNKSDKCYIWFDKKIPTSEDTLAKLNIAPNEGIPDFSKIATTDEGVYAVSDGMYGGTSYYWRGAVTNNYVKFAGFCWRIVRINGDGSIRLIYDGTSCHPNGTSSTDSLIQPTSGTTNYQYNASYNQSNYVGWTYVKEKQRPEAGDASIDSDVKIQLEAWYSSNITGTNVSKVAEGKYCNDRNVENGTYSATGSIFYYAGYTRLNTNKVPTLSCPTGDTYVLNVGLITADEVVYAGGKYYASDGSSNNSSYYLYNDKNYWTMSPAFWNSSNARIFRVDALGSIFGDNVALSINLRPVINLKTDITFSSGNGTLNNPYVVQ